MLIRSVEVVIRTHSDEEAEMLTKEKIGKVFMGEHELARGMTSHILSRMRAAKKNGHA